MKARERFDKILFACRDRVQEEVTALIGKPFKLGEPLFRQVSKEDLFTELGGKQVLAHIRLEGEIEGIGCLLTGIKDAIYIGGTLIMLPESELENVLSDQQYSEELQDSYGEVANIICGATSVTFEEQYPKSVRLVRTEQEVVTPVKVVVESEQPIANIPYYLMTVPMQLDRRELGALQLVLPAVPFGLAGEEALTEKAPSQSSEVTIVEKPGGKATLDPVDAVERDVAGAVVFEGVGRLEHSASEFDSISEAVAQSAQCERDTGKQKKLVDELLRNGMAKMCEEVSALLGGTLKVVPGENRALTKERFLEQAGGKQVMSRMDIRGGGQGEAYLFVDIKTAVYLGGALIMLPEGELEKTARDEEFGDDASDAYGEVTNIIAGVYTSIFEEQYRSKLGFVKTSMELVVPVKIDPDSDDVFANHGYYLSYGQIFYNDRDLGRLQLLIPASALELEDLLRPGGELVNAVESKADGYVKISNEKIASATDPTRIVEKQIESADILLFTDDEGEAGRIADVIADMGYVCRTLHFKDSVNSVLTPRVQMVFLVMQEASEQGFGVAIKISSAGLPVPLVTAAPAWTRNMVLKAVKYGACDILVTPSFPGDIRNKIEINLIRKAA
jgi:chemotaxis protein CheY-P-specific phosphatase CheC